MIVGHVLGLGALLILCPLIALVSVGFVVWVIAKAPWSGRTRVVVVGATLAVGFAPLLWLVGLLAELARGLGGLGGE